MPKITFIEFDGSTTEVDGVNGATLMQTAIDNNVTGILGDCGGSCACATCHCYVAEEYLAKLAAPDETEEAMLEMAVEPKDNSRLSCQIELTDELDGLAVTLPSSQF